MSGWQTIEQLKEKGITVYGNNILVSTSVNIYNPYNLILHDNIRVDDFTIISCKGKVEIFNNVHIGSHCMISSSTKIIFGKYSGISSGVKLFGGCDDFSGDSLTNPTIPTKYLNVQYGDIVLEEHVLVGSNSIILPNCLLKKGTVIAAMSLVKKNTEEWKMYGGCPIKFLKERNKGCLVMQQQLEFENTNAVEIKINTDVEIDKTKKTIFITGGSRGIGKAIALHFKNLDYNVIISYNKSIEFAKKLSESGIYIFKMDVTNYQQCKTVIKNITEKFNKIDVLINNAGILENQLFHKMNIDQWNSVINTNLNSLYMVTHNVIQYMIEKRSGKIINISSICGIKGSKGQTNYAASKHGVIGFTKSLALEYGDSNILVNCICPGLVETDMFHNINPKITDKIIQSNPIKKVINSFEIAKTCAFLAESEFCTGTIINVDCGMSC